MSSVHTMRRPVRDVHTLQMHTVCHAELAICILFAHLSGFQDAMAHNGVPMGLQKGEPLRWAQHRLVALPG